MNQPIKESPSLAIASYISDKSRNHDKWQYREGEDT